ncbi:MAG TPA: Holliday junction resolvase RuvX [Rhodanobacteraceae bacterium]|jgi:putative Holliday junction resolvase|nr:Holliday junction resolvase RuvX [Rhodanobacteraceae bacterium]
MSCVLGFDYGQRRIGVASGNHISQSARPLPILMVNAGEPEWTRVDALLAEWKPEALIVGLPLTLDGGEQAITRAARAFATTLGNRSGLPVHLVDERHTSQEAARRFAGQRAAGAARRRDAANIDSLAAAVILESWLAQTSGQSNPNPE